MSTETFLQKKEALGTDVELRIVSNDKLSAEKLFNVLWNSVDLFEKRFSRFLRESELTYLNRTAGKKVDISQEMHDILKRSKHFAEKTNSFFNPFILPLLHAHGYKDSLTPVTDMINNYAQRRVCGIDELELGKNTVRFPEDCAIDLGGIGKGYLADMLEKELDTSLQGYCLSIGGDIKMYGKNEERKPWRILIQSATDRSKNIASFTPSKISEGIATSGTHRIRNDRTVAHQFSSDGTTPLHTTYSICTVSAESATAADVYASYILYGGVEIANTLHALGAVHSVLLQGEHVPTVLCGTEFTLL